MDTKYEEVIKKVVEVREDRKKLYGDSWMKNEDWEILAQIKNKVGRLQEFIIMHKDEKIYEKKMDTIVDLINYALFLGANDLRHNDKSLAEKSTASTVENKLYKAPSMEDKMIIVLSKYTKGCYIKMLAKLLYINERQARDCVNRLLNKNKIFMVGKNPKRYCLL